MRMDVDISEGLADQIGLCNWIASRAETQARNSRNSASNKKDGKDMTLSLVRPAPECNWDAMLQGQIGWHVEPTKDGWKVSAVFGADSLVSEVDAPENKPGLMYQTHQAAAGCEA